MIHNWKLKKKYNYITFVDKNQISMQLYITYFSFIISPLVKQ